MSLYFVYSIEEGSNNDVNLVSNNLPCSSSIENFLINIRPLTSDINFSKFDSYIMKPKVFIVYFILSNTDCSLLISKQKRK